MIYWLVETRAEIGDILKTLNVQYEKFLYLQTSEDLKRHPARESRDNLVFIQKDLPNEEVFASGYDTPITV